ncbi:hypothetical protein FOA52_014127 [Chlamydomonas sp. UWO 241]|nr:hypothetical protein FOA52_014127 [Chlamydomonas sp. UWO 241]
MHDEPGDRQQAAEGRRLPHEVLAQVLSSLRASDVGRSASVCSEWRSAADQETVAWSTAAAELDPFGAIGPDGVAEMLEWAGGSWLRLARTLASPAPRAFKQGVFSSFLFNPALRPASQPSVPPPVLVVASGASGARARDAIALRTAVSEAPPWATIRISGVFHLGELPLTIRKGAAAA